MANDELTLRISAKTDDFVKKVDDAKTKVRSLAMQMSEIDKQLKTESVDRVQKLGEKLELAKRASEAAAKEAELYGEKIKKLTDKNENLNNLTDRQKESLLKLSEQYATAQQKANTYAAEVNKLEKEYNESAAAAELAENANENLADSLDDVSTETENLSEKTKEGKENTRNFFQQLKEGVAINLVTDGLKKIGSFFANIATKALEAAKAVVSFAKDYAKEAISMAADYEDALGYSEQVFGKQADTVQEWVKKNSVALRLNVSDLQSYVNNMGSLYRSFGFEEKRASELSEMLINRAADLKSATGQELPAVIESLTSVMTGGYKAGYKYGIVINETSLNAYALSHNLADVAVNEDKVKEASLKVEKATQKVSKATLEHGENSLEARDAQLALEKAEKALEDALGGQAVALTQAQKEEAIYGMIMDQTAHIAGQSAREAGGYKSQLDALKTTFDNLKISIGDKLLPVATDLITKFNEFINSKEGQALLDSIVESVSKLADKTMELLNDGRLEEWLGQLKEKVPEVADKIVEFAEKIAELIPQLLDLIPQLEILAEKTLAFLGIGNGAEMARAQENFIRCKEKVQEFAKDANISLEQATEVVQAFATETHTNVSEIYGDWDKYSPLIAAYYEQLSTEADGTATDFETAMSRLPAAVQENLDATVNTDFTKADELRAKVRSWADDIISGVKSGLEWISNIGNSEPHSTGGGSSASDEIYVHRASGGPGKAGQLYRVNDDHGRRIEVFRPYFDGEFLDGNASRQIVNNSTNNSRTYGDTIINVNSYGADTATIADEIGAAVNRKLRMAGSW